MRPTPSAFMMNGPIWSFGGESTLKSGTSNPAQRCCSSSHQTCLRSGSQGWPARSQDARLYSSGPTHVIDSALAGAHIGTMPFKVMDMLFNHPLTDKGL